MNLKLQLSVLFLHNCIVSICTVSYVTDNSNFDNVDVQSEKSSAVQNDLENLATNHDETATEDILESLKRFMDEYERTSVPPKWFKNLMRFKATKPLPESTTQTYDDVSSEYDDTDTLLAEYEDENSDQNDDTNKSKSKVGLPVKTREIVERSDPRQSRKRKKPPGDSKEVYEYGFVVDKMRKSYYPMKPRTTTPRRGEADFVTELFRYMATLVEDDQYALIKRKFGITEPTNVIDRLNVQNPYKYIELPTTGSPGDAFTKITRFPLGSTETDEIQPQTGLVAVFPDPEDALSGKWKKKYCLWKNNTLQCNDSIVDGDSFKDRVPYTGPVVNKLNITFKDKKSSSEGTSFNSYYNNLPIIISVLLNKAHKEKDLDNSAPGRRYMRGLDYDTLQEQKERLLKQKQNSSRYKFGTLYDDYEICDIDGSSLLRYHKMLFIVTPFMILLYY